MNAETHQRPPRSALTRCAAVAPSTWLRDRRHPPGRSDGAFDLPEGTLYPALHRARRRRAAVESVSEVGGRRRRVYQLTAKGQRLTCEAPERVARLQPTVLAVVQDRL